jgi:hypothetical protein
MKNSILEKLPLKIIANIAKLCIEDGFEYFSPYNDFEDNIEILQTASVWTSQRVDSPLDLEFMSKFITINEKILVKWIDEDLNFKEIASDLIIPKVKSFKVRYEQWGPATYTQQYSTEWKSYDKDWVKSSMNEETISGTWYYADGEYVGHEVDNWEPDNDKILYVEEIASVNEAVKQKIILENTSELLKQIDKKSLIELRDLINQRLSSF